MPVRKPRLRIIRRLGTDLPGLTRKSPNHRTAPPGQHGVASGRRRRPSEFRKSLEEKQKVRFNYGVTERQMQRYMERARAMAGVTGTNLLSMLERRLDNVVFRLGFAPTIPAARQLVSHGHVRVNGKRVDRPAYELAVGEEIALRDGAPRLDPSGAPHPMLRLPRYLAYDEASGTGRMIALPDRADVGVNVEDGMIIEFYAR